MIRGLFISIEGIEGVGKSSNIDTLVDTLEEYGISVVKTREPGGTALAEDIRELLVQPRDEAVPEVAELMLMFAARALNVNNVIEPALDAGRWVVCDRFTDSSRAYQGGGRGIAMSTINELAQMTHPDTNPDLTLLLDAPVEIGLGRASRRGKADRFELERTDFFNRVRECYLQLAAAEPNRITVLDTSRDLETVQADVRQIALSLVESHADRS